MTDFLELELRVFSCWPPNVGAFIELGSYEEQYELFSPEVSHFITVTFKYTCSKASLLKQNKTYQDTINGF